MNSSIKSSNNVLKVLAVADPAVYAYTDPRYHLLDQYYENSNVTVEFEIVSFNDYYGTMMDTFAGKNHYDIVMVAGHLWLKDFVTKGYLAEVDYPIRSNYNKEDILHVIAEEMKVDGKTYLYPSFCDGHILLYRKSVVEKVFGKTLPEAVDTNTVLELAAQCNGVENMKGIALKAHPSEIFLDFLPYLRSEGIDAFDAQTHAPTFNNEKGVTALDKYISLKRFAPETTHLFANDEVREAFQQKKVALTVNWGGQLGVVLNDNCLEIEDVGFAAIKTAWNVTWSFAISQRSENKELANDFLTYITSPCVDRIIGSYAGSPVRKSTYIKDSETYNWYNTHLNLIEKYAKPLPMMDLAGEKTAPLYEQVYEAFIGKKDPAEALKDAEMKINSVTKK